MSTLGAIVLGGITALVLEWTVFRPRPTQVPLIMSSSSSLSPVAALAPYELENKIRINRCHDLYSYICALQNPKDPTGEVRRDSEGEVEVLRLYESIIRERGKVKSSDADAILAEKVYTPARVAVMRALFEEVKTDLLKFIDAQPFAALGTEDKQLLKDRISDVILELPPPASVYADEPKLLTKTDVFF